MSSEKKDQPERYTFESISSSHMWFLRLSTFVPLKNKSFSHPSSLLLQLCSHFVATAYYMMWTGYGIRMLQRRDFGIDFIGEEILVTSFFLRYLIVCFKRQQLGHLVKSCEMLWGYLESGEDLVVRQFERKGHYFRNFMLYNTIVTCSMFIVTAHFIRLPPLEANGTERRVLPYRFFVDVQEEPWFSAAYTFQIVAIYFVIFIFAGLETLSLYLIMMACGYLRSVQYRLLNNRECDYDTREKSEAAFMFITGCARFHQQIMIFCKDIDQMMRMIFLLSCFCPIYNVPITAIKILDGNKNILKYVPFLFYNLFQFFACQWAPAHLLEESEMIAEAAYFSSLQPQAPSHRDKINRILYFMIMRAQKPVQLTAGGIVNLSIETFGAMTKSAFSFFMILRNFRS